GGLRAARWCAAWSGQHPWGARREFPAARGDDLPVELYAKGGDEDTSIVPVTHGCFKNGFRSSVREICRIAHAKGALVLVDDYQDCGTRPVNVKELDVDFYVTGTLKYLLGPSGVAFLYFRKVLIPLLEP